MRILILLAFCFIGFSISTPSHAQIDITQYGKGKTSTSALSVQGGPTSFLSGLNPFKTTSPALSFEAPVSAMDRFNQNTAKFFGQTKDAITLPMREMPKIDLWPDRPEAAPKKSSFQLIPDWMKPNSAGEPARPTEIADWLQP